MRPAMLLGAFAALLAAAACNSPTPPPQPAASASALVVTAPSASAVPSASASAVASAAPSAAPAESASVDAGDEGPLPSVKITNIGMHIGGGPNDAYTKEPIAKSIEPHFDEMRRCWPRVYDTKRGGDVSTDLLIPQAGGKAQVTHMQASMKGERFDECLKQVFESIDFLPPKSPGPRKVSYALRFTPDK